jgi:hypothetical protein
VSGGEISVVMPFILGSGGKAVPAHQGTTGRAHT